MSDEKRFMAARNNADLYAAMFDAWAFPFSRTADVFLAHGRPPPYYSHATVQRTGQRGAVIDYMKEMAETFDGRFGIKDSFCDLGLEADGFAPLFSAEWIWRAPRPATLPQGWAPVTTDDGLAAWESAWKDSGSPTAEHMFRPALLDRDDIVLLAHQTDAGVTAGCLANKSVDCVGLSNAFSRDGKPILETAAKAIAAVVPDMPLVGYESGDALGDAKLAGFTPVGALTIFVPSA